MINLLNHLSNSYVFMNTILVKKIPDNDNFHHFFWRVQFESGDPRNDSWRISAEKKMTKKKMAPIFSFFSAGLEAILVKLGGNQFPRPPHMSFCRVWSKIRTLKLQGNIFGVPPKMGKHKNSANLWKWNLFGWNFVEIHCRDYFLPISGLKQLFWDP